LDEKTPHIHCVVIPIVKKLDKRSGSERYTISKKQYIKDKNHLSELQDKYHKRLISKGYDLERGIKNSDNEILI
jgi:plasmid recombination enzyme